MVLRKELRASILLAAEVDAVRVGDDFRRETRTPLLFLHLAALYVQKVLDKIRLSNGRILRVFYQHYIAAS